MPLTLVMNPRQLTWGAFQVVDQPIDDRGSKVSARVDFTFEYPDFTAVKKGNEFALADNMKIIIEPAALIWKDSQARSDKKKGDALLSHEQFHYELAYAIGRVVLMKMHALRAPTPQLLRAKLDEMLALHFKTRAGLISRRYDLDTKHGLDPQQQALWKRLLRQTLANPNARTMGGYWL